MKRLSKEIEKYMQKTLRKKSKKEKINSLFSGRTPVPEKHIPTTISQLDHSGIKINELCTEFLKDPKSCKPPNLYSDMNVSMVSENNASIEPITIHDSATEILASLTSHAPIPYKIYPITIQPPDYTGFKMNKIHSDILKGPRLATFSKLYSGINVSGVPEYSLLTESESETEIKGSCDNHAPIQYKLIQISIPPPGYSGFKINKLRTEIMKDPRLYNPSNLFSGIEVSGVSEDKPPIEPTTEVSGLYNSHAPIPYNNNPITIPHKDYSGLKMNKLPKQVSKDQRSCTPSKIYNGIVGRGVPTYCRFIKRAHFYKPASEINASSNNILVF
jgi:hypothetical protein